MKQLVKTILFAGYKRNIIICVFCHPVQTCMSVEIQVPLPARYWISTYKVAKYIVLFAVLRKKVLKIQKCSYLLLIFPSNSTSWAILKKYLFICPKILSEQAKLQNYRGDELLHRDKWRCPCWFYLKKIHFPLTAPEIRIALTRDTYFFTQIYKISRTVYRFS